jgi:hypothetical protein
MATDLAYMFLDPLQNLDVVFETIVQASSFENFFTRQKSIRTDPVVKGHHNDIHVRCLDETSSVVVRLRIFIVPSTLDPDIYWQKPRTSLRLCRCINIKE